MADIVALTRTIDAFDSQRQALLERITALVVADFERFDGWYSTRLVDEVAAQVATRLTAGQLGTAQLTDAYLARTTSYVMGRVVTGSGVPLVMGQTLRAGVKDHDKLFAQATRDCGTH